MQPEHPHQQDTAPLPDPSSPPVPDLYRHHRPAPTADPWPATADPGLRHRPNAPSDEDYVKIDIRTPYDETSLQRSGSVAVLRTKRISELKDEIARGDHGNPWVREGLRLVWQGRIARDEELVGEVVSSTRGNRTNVFHLVARRIGGTPAARPTTSYFASHLSTPAPPTPTPAAQAAPIVATPVSSMMGGTSIEQRALADCIHYLLFEARHYLFLLLGKKPLAWSEMVPSPVVGQNVARQAVKSVMKAVVESRPEPDRSIWSQYQSVFQDAPPQDVEEMRRTIEADWLQRVGRPWKNDQGEVVDVDVDGTTYHLHLPPISSLTTSQLHHLFSYLRITTFLPLLYPLLQPAPLSHSPPTRTVIMAVPPPPLPTRTTFTSIFFSLLSALPRIPISVLSHMFFSALKLMGMLWMLTQGMAWSDGRLWTIGAAAAGWWVGDGYQQYLVERRRIRRQNPDPTPAPPQPDSQGQNAQPAAGNGVEPMRAAVNAQAPQAAPAAGSRHGRPSRPASPFGFLPKLHLNMDSAQLLLPIDNRDPSNSANRPTQAPTRPPWIVTQLILPIILWFVTLIPEFESIRYRTIRTRERAIRIIVGELNSPLPSAAAHPEEDGAEGERNEERGEPILPEGLGEEAKKYYLRVLDKGEGIDWEEEREAQRAMGVGEEEEAGGGFIGLF